MAEKKYSLPSSSKDEFLAYLDDRGNTSGNVGGYGLPSFIPQGYEGTSIILDQKLDERDSFGIHIHSDEEGSFKKILADLSGRGFQLTEIPERTSVGDKNER